MSGEAASVSEAAVRKYVELLDDSEKSRIVFTNVDEVFRAAEALERRQAVLSRSRRISRRIEPVIRFLQQYARVIDQLVQYDPHPSALAWGSIRFLIEAAASFSSYFAKILSMMEQIGDKLPTYQCYEKMFADSKSFRAALIDVYFDILLFLCKASAIFKSSGLKTFAKSIWKPFESDFAPNLQGLTRHIAKFEAETTLAHRQTLHVERRRRVMEWLSPVDTEQDFQREMGKRTKGTGQWLTSNDTYSHWRDVGKSEPVLWINGRPGIGKSVLCATILEDLHHRKATSRDTELLYFFFDKSDNKKTTFLSFCASIMGQLLGRMQTIPSMVFTAYEAATRYGRLNMSMSDDPIKMLRSLVSSLPSLFIVLDGLDECSEATRVLDFVLELIRHSSSIRLVSLSREVDIIKKQLGSFTIIKLETAYMQSDIDTFLQAEITALSKSLGEDNLYDLLFRKLSQDADGVFLWAYLMMHNIKSAPSLFELEEMMKRLPHGLAEVYESTLTELTKETSANQKLAKKIFFWVCSSTSHLSWSELQCALALDPEDFYLNPAKKPFKNVVLRLCCPLIEYQEDQDTFRPIHLSVCEFLIYGSSILTPHTQLSSVRRFFCTSRSEAQYNIAGGCLTYLSIPSVADTHVLDANQSPLSRYATSNLSHHLTQAPNRPTLHDQLVKFLSEPSRRRAWQARWLLIHIAVCPLQHLLKEQRAIQAWASAGKSDAGGLPYDILDDMFDVLLYLDASQQYVFSPPKSGFQRSIGNFEKMMVIRDLARAYTVTGRLNDAERWLEAALLNQQQRYGENELEVVWILNTLGILYDQQLRFQLSADTQLKAMDIQKARLPADHLDIVWTVNELGRVYRHLWLLDQAEAMHLQALSILETIFPEDDLQIIWTINTLARTYRFQKRLDEALNSHQRALAQQQRSMGIDHAHSLWTMTDIGRCFRDQGRLLEALEMQMAALEGRKRILGAKHTDTLWSMNDVGLLLTSLGRKREAKSYHETALQGQRVVLGENNPTTLWTRNLLDSWTD